MYVHLKSVAGNNTASVVCQVEIIVKKSFTKNTRYTRNVDGQSDKHEIRQSNTVVKTEDNACIDVALNVFAPSKVGEANMI